MEVDMLRTFTTHRIRKQTELSGRTWNFTPLGENVLPDSFPVVVPSCWESYPGFENYRGIAEYETTFEGEGNVSLEFKGVAHQAWIFVDGMEVGSHYNAYTPFRILLKNISRGNHRLVVRADNSFQKEYALNRPNDYMSYGGIIRGVVQEELKAVYIENLHVTPLEKTEEGWKTRFEVFINNISENGGQFRLYTAVRDLMGNPVFQHWSEIRSEGKEQKVEECFIIPGVEDWMPDHPVLYEVEVRLCRDEEEIDDLIDRTGFRTVKVQENRICINGRAVRIKGFCRHEDYGLLGSALPGTVADYDLRLLRDLGANAIRTAHYPNDEYFLDLCDERGILVWEEHHVRGGDERIMGNPKFEFYCEQVIEEMIRYHYNHPSIYIWGILNECASDTEMGRLCYEKQYSLIRKLDQSRLCSSATCKYETDICLDLPDVVSWNMYPGWYDDKEPAERLEELYRWSQAEGRGKGKPFLITEIGAGAIYGYHSHTYDKWTEEYQSYLLEKQVNAVMADRKCSGLYIWQFADVRVSREWFGSRPRSYNNKGITDEYRRRKLAYETVKRIYRGQTDYWDE